ncbi:unnamed protein product [Diplocarpon coronariae]
MSRVLHVPNANHPNESGLPLVPVLLPLSLSYYPTPLLPCSPAPSRPSLASLRQVMQQSKGCRPRVPASRPKVPSYTREEEHEEQTKKQKKEKKKKGFLNKSRKVFPFPSFRHGHLSPSPSQDSYVSYLFCLAPRAPRAPCLAPSRDHADKGRRRGGRAGQADEPHPLSLSLSRETRSLGCIRALVGESELLDDPHVRGAFPLPSRSPSPVRLGTAGGGAALSAVCGR